MNIPESHPFRKCDGCRALLPRAAFTWETCPECGQHHAMSAALWRELLLDDGALELWDDDLVPTDPLSFVDDLPYSERTLRAQKKSGYTDAFESGRAALNGLSVAYGAFVFAFLGGSMGSVVGERITRLFERAAGDRLPVVLLSASGGARMQEGILGLMQMAKTVAARERLREARVPFISVLRHPTTGGVAASFAFLGDINIAEPGALIGFAGPRVIEQALQQSLPEGFQRAEFLLEHGMVDRVTPRSALKREIASLLRLLEP